MQRLIEQLEAVRWRARITLVAMRVSTWLCALLGAMLLLAVGDYLLRLPGWLRLILGLALVVAALAWAVVKIGRSLRVDVALTTMAQRLERLYPAASGRLASAVAFSTQLHPEAEAEGGGGGGGSTGAGEDSTRQLQQQTRRDAEGVLEREQIVRLLDARRAWRQAALLGITVIATAGLAAASPASASIAAQRWLKPLGDAAWPNRFEVQSLTDRDVAPNHVPLRLSAQVTKGDRPDLRTWAGYQFLEDARQRPRAGAWQRTLMTRQDHGEHGQYERLVEVPGNARAIAFFFEAGDDQTSIEVVELIEPPTLAELVASVQPPAYAADFVAAQQQYLLTPPRPSVTVEALAGSRVELEMRIRGSFDPPASIAEADADADADPDAAGRQRVTQWVRHTLAGLIDDETDIEAMDLSYELVSRAEDDTRLRVGWDLRQTGQFQFRLADAHGTRYEDQRVFRFEARQDREPNASILTPGSDQQVLATAEVDLAAEGYDDVAVERMTLQASVSDRDDAHTLAQSDEPEPRVTLQTQLDLSELELEEGDEVGVVAVVQDNFELDGERHEAVESSIRWLRIISDEEMQRQLQTELADLRQRAVRARQAQQDLRDADADRRTASRQQEMVERLEAMSRSIEDLEERIDRNRLDAEGMRKTLEQSDQMMQQGAEQAGQAADRLARAASGDEDDPQTQQELEQGRAAQDEVAAELDRLVQLLDQGQDAYEIQEQLTRLQREQDVLRDEVSELLPRTLGQSLEDLAEADREALAEAGESQGELAEDAEELLERMRSTAAGLARHAERPEEQAIAEALRQAAATADEQALQEHMDEAAEEVGENRLSQAQQQQDAAREVLREMMEQLGRVDELRQEILSRQLLELVESIRELRDQQAAELERLRAVEAAALATLDEPMIRLRRNTLSVADDARQAGEDTFPVAALLEQAAEQMADAVRVFRDDEPDADAAEQAERNALRKLNEALALAEELAQQAQEDMSQQERQELVRAYRQAMERQRVLREETEPIAEVEAAERNRRWRAEAREKGDEQHALREELGELEEKLADTIVYRSMHEQMDSWAARAAGSLREGDAGVRTVFDQEMVISTLEALIESLQSLDEDDDAFADGGGGGGGGGDAGEPGDPELIPDIAELRLLRSRQVLVRDLTRRVDEDGAVDDQLVEELSQQQQSLSQIGEQLIEQLSQQMQGGPGPGEMPAPDAEPEGDAEPGEQPDPAPDGLDDLPGLEPELERQLKRQSQQQEDEPADAETP